MRSLRADDVPSRGVRARPVPWGRMGEVVAWAFELAEEKLAGVLPSRWAHVQGVGRRARLAAPLFSADDCELLVGAALLHDIGYSPELVGTTTLPMIGKGRRFGW